MPEPLRVLIIADQQQTRQSLAEMVTLLGYAALQAADGSEVLSLADAGQADILLSNLVLPDMDVATLLQQLAGRNIQLPVIIVTEGNTLDAAIEALRLGAFDYLLRPFRAPLVEAALRRATSAVLRVRAEAERDLFQASLNGAEDGIAIIDPQGIVLFANPTASLLFAVPKEEAVGQRIATLLGRNSAHLVSISQGAAMTDYVARLVSPEPLEPATLTILAPEKCVFETRRIPLHHPSGALRAYLLLWRDITEEKEAERAREQMGHIIVHDLRNPMSLVRVGIEAAQMFLPRETNADALQGLSLALQGVNQLERKTAILLAVSQIESGEQALNLRLVSLTSLIEAAQSFYDFELKERHIVLTVNMASDLPLVCADSDLVEWALGDLVYNAVRYSPSHGQIEIRAERDGEGVAVTINDQGPAIAPEDQVHTFAKFPHKEGLDVRRSAGLRLYFARLVMEAHGGTISVTSGPRTGCAFRLWLPVLPCQAQATAPSLPDPCVQERNAP